MMKILVVDDEQDIRSLFEQHFRKEIRKGEMDFVFAFSGEEAMDYINSGENEAVLILSDINMPGMSGLELLHNIREKYATPPPVVMMITAYGDAYNYHMAMENGANDFLTKPLDFGSLKLKLNALIL
ncbi:MAG: response regulator [Marinilabiliales bacterium]|nr:response regulator [Marinilabiliales bacterium]